MPRRSESRNLHTSLLHASSGAIHLHNSSQRRSSATTGSPRSPSHTSPSTRSTSRSATARSATARSATASASASASATATARSATAAPVPRALQVVLDTPQHIRDLVDVLDLSHQGMGLLPPDLFGPFGSITSLDVSFNELQRIPVPLIAAHMPALASLDLRHNLIVTLKDVQELASLDSLASLNLLGNPIPYINRRVHLIRRLIYDQIDDYPLTGTHVAPYAGPLARALTAARDSQSRDPDILCSARSGMAAYLGLDEGNAAPHVVKSQLAAACRGPNRSTGAIMYADMRTAPTPRDGPFPALSVLNGKPITIEDLDSAHMLESRSGVALGRRLEAEAAYVEASDLFSSASLREKEREYRAIYESVLGSAITSVDRMDVSRGKGGLGSKSSAASALLRSIATSVHTQATAKARNDTKARMAAFVSGQTGESGGSDDDPYDGGSDGDTARGHASSETRDATAVDQYLDLLRKSEAASLVSDDDLAAVLQNPVTARKLKRIRNRHPPPPSGEAALSASDGGPARPNSSMGTRLAAAVDPIDPLDDDDEAPPTMAASGIYYECAIVLNKSDVVIPDTKDATVYDDPNIVTAAVPFAVYKDVPTYEELPSAPRRSKASGSTVHLVGNPHWVESNPQLRSRARRIAAADAAAADAAAAERRAAAAAIIAKAKTRAESFRSAADEPPSLPMSPFIYSQFQGLRRDADKYLEPSKLDAVSRLVGATSQQLGELFATLDSQEIETVLRLADLDLEVVHSGSSSRKHLVNEQTYLARAREAAEQRERQRHHRRRVELIRAGVLKSYTDVELDPSLDMIVPDPITVGSVDVSQTQAVGSRGRATIVSRSTDAILSLDPDELKNHLASSGSTHAGYDPISLLAADGSSGPSGSDAGGDDDDDAAAGRAAQGQLGPDPRESLAQLQSFTSRRLNNIVADMCEREGTDNGARAAELLRTSQPPFPSVSSRTRP